MNIAKTLKVIGGLGGAIIVVILLAVGYFVYTRYWVYQASIETILLSLPPDEAFPPATVKEVVRKVDGDFVASRVPLNLVLEIQTERKGMLEFHLQEAVWFILLPYSLSEDQRIALYCHYLAFENGRGLAYGARHYYSKTPDNLTVAEVLELLTISRSPDRFSPTRNPDLFREKRDRLKKNYEAFTR